MTYIRSLATTLACLGGLALLGCSERADQQPLTPDSAAAQAPGRTQVDAPAEPVGAPGDLEGLDEHAGGAPATTPPGADERASSVRVGSGAPTPPVDSATPDSPSPPVYRGPGDSTPGRGGTGTLRGVVRFEGELELPPLVVEGDHGQECASVDKTNPSLVLDRSRGLANVVLTIAVAGRSATPLAEPAVIEQRGCRFEPHVLLVPAGSTVRYSNADTCSATIHTNPRSNEATNTVVPTGGEHDEVYAKSDTIAIQNDVHPWMSGWVVVTDAPFHALSGPDGSFEITGLPPGPLQLTLWHERLRQRVERVDIVDGEVTEVQLSMRLE